MTPLYLIASMLAIASGGALLFLAPVCAAGPGFAALGSGTLLALVTLVQTLNHPEA